MAGEPHQTETVTLQGACNCLITTMNLAREAASWAGVGGVFLALLLPQRVSVAVSLERGFSKTWSPMTDQSHGVFG